MQKNIFWPQIDDLWSAKKACIQASSGAFLIAIVTGAVTYFQIKGSPLLQGIPSGSFLDCGIFLILGFFIYRCSRIASVAGLIVYAAGQIIMLPQMHSFSVMPIFLALFFIGGIRGAFDYHEMKKGMSSEEIKATLKEQKEATDPAPSLKKRITAWIILVLLVAGGFLIYRMSPAYTKSARSHVVIEDSVPAAVPKKIPAVKPVLAEPSKPLPGEQTFKMKDGRVINGRVVGDDPVYYTVETSGGRQEIVIKEDLAQ